MRLTFALTLASLLVATSTALSQAAKTPSPAPNAAPGAGPSPTPAPAAAPATPTPAAAPTAPATPVTPAAASGASASADASPEAADAALTASIETTGPLPSRPLNVTSNANHRPTFGMAALAGIGGDVQLEYETAALDPSFGLLMRYEVPLHPLFVVGSMVVAQFWIPQITSTQSLGRSPLFDLSIYPKLRYAPTRELEIYAKVPIGGSLDSGDDQTFGGGTGMAFGWNLWGMVGVHISTTPTSGVFIEGGASLHRFTQEVNPDGPGENRQVEVDMRQFMFTLGLYADS